MGMRTLDDIIDEDRERREIEGQAQAEGFSDIVESGTDFKKENTFDLSGDNIQAGATQKDSGLTTEIVDYIEDNARATRKARMESKKLLLNIEDQRKFFKRKERATLSRKSETHPMKKTGTLERLAVQADDVLVRSQRLLNEFDAALSGGAPSEYGTKLLALLDVKWDVYDAEENISGTGSFFVKPDR